MILIDTYNNNGWSYSDYKAEMEENDLFPGDENSNSFYSWLSERINMDIEDFWDNLGLWWGRPEIQSTRFRNLAEAIHKCVDGAQDMVVTLEKGILTVEGLHHDGTNCFTIHREHGYFWPKYLF